jgi:hypothetical protein
MVSHRTSQSFVKKKAALTLLRLYRKHPDVIPSDEWALRIVSIMDDEDLVRGSPPPILPSKSLDSIPIVGRRGLRDKLGNGTCSRQFGCLRCLLH